MVTGANRGALARVYTAAARSSWLRRAVVSTPLLRDIPCRFIGGDDLDAAAATVRGLNARRIQAALSFVGTHVRDKGCATAAADMAVESLHRIARDRLQAHISIKLTQIGLDIDEEVCRSHLRRVLNEAACLGTFVCIDMEESAYTDRTLRLFHQMRSTFGAQAVGIAIQSYLRHRRNDLKELIASGARIRLVKGGYFEPRAVVYRNRREIDTAFAGDMDLLLRPGLLRPAIATHDGALIERAQMIASSRGLGRREYEFEMLYGVKPQLQNELIDQGYTVRCYVPYGIEWSPYMWGCARRAMGSMLPWRAR